MSFASRTLFGLEEESSAAAVNSYDGSDATADAAFGACTLRIYFKSNGVVSAQAVPGGATLVQHHLPSRWFSPLTAGVGSDYWVRAVHVSGDTVNAGAAVNTWLSLATNRYWGIHASPGEDKEGVYTFEISSESDGTPLLASGDITLAARGGDGPGDQPNF